MKNIHILPTDKSSRLSIKDGVLILHRQQWRKDTQHIYTTSDEEIKDGDWVLEISTNAFWQIQIQDKTDLSKYKKIILTTDQDLIKKGVQAIDDEFLEWFVKNPSCEFVEFDKEEDELVSPKNPKIRFNYLQDPPSFISAESLNNMILTYKYKIIIPKEKPKQEPCDNCNNEVCCCIVKKQETLEEFIKKQLSLGKYQDQESAIRHSIELGAKWQQEQDKKLYNEVFEWLAHKDYLSDEVEIIQKEFEEFKNK